MPRLSTPKRLLPTVTLAALLASAALADNSSPQRLVKGKPVLIAPDAEGLQGTWRAVEVEIDGEAIPVKAGRGVRVVIQRAVYYFPDDPDHLEVG